MAECQKSAVACATRATFAKVKSSAMTARQPSVPNLIAAALIGEMGDDLNQTCNGWWKPVAGASRSNPDRMPCGFEFDRIENPIRVLRFRVEPVGSGEGMI